ncbi:hypothetical protein, partial [Clostridium diolis]|uniref:hypothetical protein n=1 Tax=Clostridium diolis TaxID=223919 RepID=UPI0019D41682
MARMTAQRRFGPVARRPRRATEWLGIATADVTSDIATATQQATFLSSAALTALGLDPPFTITRTILHWYHRGSSVGTSRLAIGVHVTDDIAGAAGAVPSPLTNLGFDGWLLHYASHAYSPNGAGDGYASFARRDEEYSS